MPYKEIDRDKSIAECSKGSILQYFRPSLSYRLSLRSLFCLFLSGRFILVLLYSYELLLLLMLSLLIKFPPVLRCYFITNVDSLWGCIIVWILISWLH